MLIVPVIEVIVGRHRVGLLRGTVEGERLLCNLVIDGREVERISLSASYSPKLAASPTEVAIWSTTELYIAPLGGGAVQSHTLPEEIEGAYPVAEQWIVVCKHDLVTLDPRRRRATTQYTHDQMIVGSHWEGDELTFIDLQRRWIKFRVVPPDFGRPELGLERLP